MSEKKEMKVLFEITVPVVDASENLFFTQGGGSGTYNGEEFWASMVVGIGNPIIRFRDKRYMVDNMKVFGAILEKVTKDA